MNRSRQPDPASGRSRSKCLVLTQSMAAALQVFLLWDRRRGKHRSHQRFGQGGRRSRSVHHRRRPKDASKGMTFFFFFLIHPCRHQSKQSSTRRHFEAFESVFRMSRQSALTRRSAVEQVMQSLRFALQAAAEDITLTWDLPKEVSVTPLSPPLTTIFQGQRSLIYARLTGQVSAPARQKRGGARQREPSLLSAQRPASRFSTDRQAFWLLPVSPSPPLLPFRRVRGPRTLASPSSTTWPADRARVGLASPFDPKRTPGNLQNAPGDRLTT